MAQPVDVSLSVNGAPQRRAVEPRLLLSDFLRQDLGLTGTHVGCEHGVCGACTVLLDGEAVRSCLVFAVQADGAEVDDRGGAGPGAGPLHPLQEAFRDAHGLQCGFCTPGILMSMVPFLRDNPTPDEPRSARRCPATCAAAPATRTSCRRCALAAERMRGGDGASPAAALGEARPHRRPVSRHKLRGRGDKRTGGAALGTGWARGRRPLRAGTSPPRTESTLGDG